MPFQSEKQRRFLHANHPEIAKRWEKEYANGGISNHFRRKFASGTWTPGAGRDKQGYQSSHPQHSGGGGGGGGGGPKPHSGPTFAEIQAQKKAAAAAEATRLQALENARSKQVYDTTMAKRKKNIKYYDKTLKSKFDTPTWDTDIAEISLYDKNKTLNDYYNLMDESDSDNPLNFFEKKHMKDLERQQMIELKEDFEQQGDLEVEGDADDTPGKFRERKSNWQWEGGKLAFKAGSKKDKKLRALDSERNSAKELGVTFSPKKEKQYQELLKEDKEQTDEPKSILVGAKGGVARKNYFHGGILNLNASEEIISDDGNDIELTAYNAAFDDPKDLSTGVKTLFQAKDGGRIGYAQGWSPGVAAEERAAEKSSGGGQYHGGGADVMAVQSVGHPTGDASRTRIQEETQEDFRQKEMAKTLATGPGSDEEKYDTKEQKEAEYYGLRNWQEKEKRVTKLTADFIKKNLKRLSSTKYYKEKYGDDIIGMLQKGWEVYKSIPSPTLIGIARELIAEYKLTKEGNTILEQWSDLIGGPPGTNPQAYDDLYYALEKRKAKYRYDDDTGDDGPEPIYAPLTGAVSEEYAQGDYDFDSRANWNAMKQKQALNAALQEKWAAEKEAHEQLYMVANSGGLANLFRVKNQ